MNVIWVIPEFVKCKCNKFNTLQTTQLIKKNCADRVGLAFLGFHSRTVVRPLSLEFESNVRCQGLESSCIGWFGSNRESIYYLQGAEVFQWQFEVVLT